MAQSHFMSLSTDVEMGRIIGGWKWGILAKNSRAKRYGRKMRVAGNGLVVGVPVRVHGPEHLCAVPSTPPHFEFSPG